MKNETTKSKNVKNENYESVMDGNFDPILLRKSNYY